MPLPNPGMSFTPFDPLPASDLNDIVENIEGLQDWSAFDAGSFDVALIAAGGLPASKLDSNAIGAGYLELGRATLGVAGDLISVTPIPAMKYLRIVAKTYASGQIAPVLRFNNDSGNNYANRNTLNGAADTTQVSAANLFVTVTAAAENMFSITDITNDTSNAKLALMSIMGEGSSGAGNAPNRRTATGKWQNTAAQITRVDCVNTGTGDFAIGSQVIVFGKN